MKLPHIPGLLPFLLASWLTAAPLGAQDLAASPTDPQDISGVWWVDRYDPRLSPVDGSAVPYTAAARIEHDKAVAAIKAGTLEDAAVSKCLLPGLPRAMISAYPMKIVQHDRSVTVIHEQNHSFWHAVIGIWHAAEDMIEPSFMGGDSVARWEGDTLVIDSIGFKEKSFLDDEAMPHTDALHIVQRIRKIDGGRRLENLMTIEDSGVFTKAWTARRTFEWRPDVRLMEYVCGDPHRALTGDRVGAVRLPRKLP